MSHLYNYMFIIIIIYIFNHKMLYIWVIVIDSMIY